MAVAEDGRDAVFTFTCAGGNNGVGGCPGGFCGEIFGVPAPTLGVDIFGVEIFGVEIFGVDTFGVLIFGVPTFVGELALGCAVDEDATACVVWVGVAGWILGVPVTGGVWAALGDA